jgi:hypothetical protein
MDSDCTMREVLPHEIVSDDDDDNDDDDDDDDD